MTTSSGVLPPPLTWQYRGDTISYNNPSTSSAYYTAVYHVVGLTTMSNATINSVPLSHHNSMINCLSVISTIHSEAITIAGNEVLEITVIFVYQRCSTISIKPEYHCQQATSSTNMATSS